MPRVNPGTEALEAPMHPMVCHPILAIGFVLGIGVFGCDRQPTPPPQVKAPPTAPETVVGEMADTAMGKAKGVEGTLGKAAEHTRETVNAPGQ